jgi:tripartite-type tricarboxylate transporter receptor subunit TctC
MSSRRRFLAGVAAGTVGAYFLPPLRSAISQIIARPARLIVGFPAGGVVDVVARLLADNMKGYASSLVVDNRPGAGGRLALELVKGSEADGSVMALTPVDQLSLFPNIYTRLPYRPLEDFVPVTTVCSFEFVLAVGPLVPASVRSPAEFVVWCRENLQASAYGTAGAGTHPHFVGVAFAHAARFEFAHVPYKGGIPAAQDVMGGHLAACISTVATVLPAIRSGALRALATTGARHSAALPEVSTFAEAGYPAVESVERFGVLVPARTPAEQVSALSKTIRAALDTEPVRTGFKRLSLDPAPASAAEFAQLIAVDTQHWAQVVKASGFTPTD